MRIFITRIFCGAIAKKSLLHNTLLMKTSLYMRKVRYRLLWPHRQPSRSELFNCQI